jgi:signal transduction histidine kinase
VAHEAATTLSQIHELNTTLDELLRVARKGSTGERTELDITALVDHHVTDWQDQFAKKRRQIIVTTGVVQPVIGTPGLIGQILNVLIENSLQHGRGTVAILVTDTSVLIEDEGHGIDELKAATIFDRPSDHQAAHGRGLSLARRLAEADGGRIELVALQPATFRLSLLSARG